MGGFLRCQICFFHFLEWFHHILFEISSWWFHHGWDWSLRLPFVTGGECSFSHDVPVPNCMWFLKGEKDSKSGRFGVESPWQISWFRSCDLCLLRIWPASLRNYWCQLELRFFRKSSFFGGGFKLQISRFAIDQLSETDSPMRRQALLFSIEAKVPIVPRRFTTQAKNSVTKRFHRSGGNSPRHTFFQAALEVGSDTPGLYWWCCGAGSLHHWMDATQMKTWIKKKPPSGGKAQINRCRSYRFNFHLFFWVQKISINLMKFATFDRGPPVIHV